MDASKAFYGELLGWQFEDTGPEHGGYVNATSDGHLVAAITPRMEGMQGPDMWTTYFSTDDAEATAATVTKAGGTVLMAPTAVGDVGTFAMAADPAGAVFGVWQPGNHFGFAKYNEPGSVTWDEHHSQDFAATTPVLRSRLRLDNGQVGRRHRPVPVLPGPDQRPDRSGSDGLGRLPAC
jgi:hypothetical protein